MSLKEEKAAPVVERCKIIQIGSTPYIRLPKEFIDRNAIKDGDILKGLEVTVVIKKNMLVTLTDDSIGKVYEKLVDSTSF